MDNQEKYKDDLIRHYVNSDLMEKTLSGFTSKVMTRIHLVTEPSKSVKTLQKKYLIPVISAVITIALIAAAILTSGSGTFELPESVASHFKDLTISIPELNLSSLFRFNIPATTIYILIGFVILTVFDRALFGIFNRKA